MINKYFGRIYLKKIKFGGKRMFNEMSNEEMMKCDGVLQEVESIMKRLL